MDEQNAITRLRHGDSGGLEPLVHAYQLRAVRTAYVIIRDRGLAEDIVQHAFIRAFERIGQLRVDQSFGSWFLRSVANDAIREAERRRQQVSLDAEGHASTMVSSLEDAELTPEEALEGVETREELWNALNALSSSQRAAIVLRYYLGLTEPEIADQLGTPVGTVKWRLHTARQHLRRLLTKESSL